MSKTCAGVIKKGNRQEMKRLIAAVAVLAVVLAAGVVALPYLVSTEGIRTQIVAQAEMLTGRRVTFRDSPKVLLDPYLGIEISNVVFEGSKDHPDDPPLAQMEKLRGRIAVLPLLLGRIEIGQYQFVRPRFGLSVFGDGRTSWDIPQGRVWQVLSLARDIRQSAEPGAGVDLSKIPILRLADFEIVDGIIDYANARTGGKEAITNINARISWPDTASAWTIRGASIWRDEAIDYAVTTARPLLLMAGGTSAATAEVKSGAFALSFGGDANLLAGLHLSGKTTFGAPSAARLAEFFGARLQMGAMLGDFRATGKLGGTIRQFQLSDAVISVDGNQGRGVVQVSISDTGRPQVNATLAFQSLDFTPYVASLREESQVDRPEGAGLRLLDLFDCDIRLSSPKMTSGPLTASDVGAALSVRNGELLFDLGSATFYGGNATGKLSLKKGQEVSELRGETTFSGMSLAPLLATLPRGTLGATGRANIKLTVKSSGSSVKQLLSRLRGWATLEAKQGTLSGTDLRRLRVAASNGEGDVGNLRLSGETAFASLKGDMIFDRRTVWIRSLELDNAELRARFVGRADLVSGGLALRARIGAADGAQPPTLLVVGGVLSAPLVSRDVEAPAD